MENRLSHLKISVVIPSFNQAQFIEQTLRSVINQNYSNLELIIIDGGSTDGSVEIIQKYQNMISYWCSEPDGSQTHGLIKGFSIATGDILCWLNSDDVFEPSTFCDVSNFFLENPVVDAVFGDTLWIDRIGKPLRYQREIPFNRFIWFYTYNYIPGMSMFWRRDIYEQVGGLNPNFNLAMDADLWIRIADVGRIAHVSKVWSRMRFYPEQKNQCLRITSNAEDLIIRSRYWKNGRPSLYRSKQIVAQAIRVSWKLITGCYSFGYKRYMDKA
jgi:glycosyltransferase involved in cell wall biosynthesis